MADEVWSLDSSADATRESGEPVARAARALIESMDAEPPPGASWPAWHREHRARARALDRALRRVGR